MRLTKGFYLGKYEVTDRQWEKVTGRNPSTGFRNAGQEDEPVERASRTDGQEFCRKLGNGFRLPTEAEWEYACRAGTRTRFCFGDDPALLCQYGNYCDRSCSATIVSSKADNRKDEAHDDGFSGPAPVGRFKPNSWGLYDMHGNVREWCQDGKYPPGVATVPRVSGDGLWRVFRGGGYNDGAGFCSSAAWGLAEARSLNGCRLARTADGP